MFLRRILSDDLPRNRLLAVLLVLIFIGLLVAPFAFPGVRPLSTDESLIDASFVGFNFVETWRGVTARDGLLAASPALRFECGVTATCR